LLWEGFFADGLCAVQDEAAGLIVRLLDPAAGERILDACAAPGGKAFVAAQLMQDRGEVVAVDVHDRRLRLVERGAKELGLRSISTVESDMRSYRPQAQFDRVLLDAPCSGFGVLSKRADLRWNRQPEDFAGLRTLQDELLDASARCVRPGGVLVYGTCTIEPEENQHRVRAFLKRNTDFELENAAEYVPRELVDEGGFYASLPFRDSIDGAFGARLRRTR
jgi:16S rRNA (cytosine967-C5)-methyltransferase